jgi:hypothetical protein
MKIYLISSEINNDILYKIGITKRDVNKRIKELKTGNAATLNIVNIFESKWASKIEANLHQTYKTKNVSGEWFRLKDDEITNFVTRCQSIHDNFELLNKSNTWFIDKNKKSYEF